MVELCSEPLMADKIVFVYIGDTWQKCTKQLVATFFLTLLMTGDSPTHHCILYGKSGLANSKKWHTLVSIYLHNS